MKIKVCGMKYKGNISEVAALKPDYLGFIFYKNSSRYYDGESLELPETIKKVGVFVNETIEKITHLGLKHNLDLVQLHGEETPEFCGALKNSNVNLELIKVFSIKDEFNFDVLKTYEEVCDYFLFDTKGELPGGNGYKFDWSVLRDYPSSKPFFLSGGIGNSDSDDIKLFTSNTDVSKYCIALDLNSKFEMEPGLKNVKLLDDFIANY